MPAVIAVGTPLDIVQVFMRWVTQRLLMADIVVRGIELG